MLHTFGTDSSKADFFGHPVGHPLADAYYSQAPPRFGDHVAKSTITIPSQDAYSPARQRFFNDEMTFRPAHTLLAHQPLGSVMRARLQVYRALSAFRNRENGIPESNPTTVSDIPA